MSMLPDVTDPDLCCEILMVLNCFTIEFPKGRECLGFFKDTLIAHFSSLTQHEFLQEKLTINSFRLLRNLLHERILLASDLNQNAG
jgi:hypothetical protein